MKRMFILSAICCITWLCSFATEDKNVVPAVLKSAIVYRSGAELTHTAQVVLNQGNNDLVIEGISNRIDINSVQIGTGGGNVTIMSVEFSTDFLKPVQKLPLVRKLEDSLELVKKESSRIDVILKTDHELLDLLKANKEIRGTQTGLSVAELTKMMDYYKVKTLELQNEISLYKDKATRANDLIARINQQITEEEQKNTKTVGKLALQLFCPVGGTYNFTISYVTPMASWNPGYDLRVENINKPIALSYKAKLVQSTGIDWQHVKLTLATSTPSQQGNAPVFKSWFLNYIDPVARMENEYRLNSIQSFNGSKSEDVLKKMAPGAMQEIRIRGAGDIKEQGLPLYVVDGNIISADDFKKISQSSIKHVEVLKDASATAIYGTQAENGVILVTLKEGMDEYVSVYDNTMNVTFDIDLPYDVPSNGKEQNVTLKEFSVPAFYKYYSAPRLDKEAYLLGEIPEWEKLNLLPGEANIIFEGTYIGKTVIDPNSTQDTLNLTLGKDKRVVVTREKVTDYSSVKFLGSNKKQSFTYEITVKNNKKEKANLILKEQYPLSTNKDIEVELLQDNGATVNTDLGVLTWKLELAPGEVKKFRVSYSVKYPKDKTLNL